MFDNYRKKIISKAALILSDVAAVCLPAALIYTFNDKIGEDHIFRIRTITGIAVFLFSILFFSQTIFEHYSVRRSFYDEFKELMQIYVFNGLAALSSLFILDLSGQRKKHLVFLVIVFLLIPLFRFITRGLLNKFNLWRIECVVISPKSESAYARAAIESQFNLGLIVQKSDIENRFIKRLMLQTDTKKNIDYSLIKSQICDYYRRIGSPHIVIYAHHKSAIYFPKIIDLLILCELPYSIIPDVGGVSLLGARFSHFFRWEVMLITPQNNIGRVSYAFLKRAFDIIFSILFLMILAFPMILIYFCIKIEGGSGIYVQERIGRGGSVFKCFKFRSMKKDAEALLNKCIEESEVARSEWEENRKIVNDPRITKIGKYLRRYSIDELPQLLNVLRGDMSLVGPRPIVGSEIRKYGKNYEFYKKVRPGVTGLWQISGRSDTTYDYRVALDVWYIKNWSIWYDIAILFKTVDAVINRIGAY